MKTKLFALCAALAVTASLAAQISIIPKPNKIEKGEGSFIFDKQTVIYTTEKSQQNASYLKGYLKNATGFTFETVKHSPVNNFIVIDIAPSYNIPAEGYSLEISTQGDRKSVV